MSANVVLVTGATRGIGHAIATHLARRGHQVFGTGRAPTSDFLTDFELVALDVTDDTSVANGVETVLARAGRVDVLINNAGYALLGAAEDTTPAEHHAIMDTNFTGAVRVTRALLPQFRQRRAGRIINVSSLGGLVALPYTGAYAASKFALEGYSEALRHELLAWNVFVSLIEPPNVRTGTLDQSVRRVTHDSAAYEDVVARLATSFLADGTRSTVRPEHVARLVERIVTHPRPALRHPIGTQARLLPLLKALLPPGTFERAVRRRLQLPGTQAPRPHRRSPAEADEVS